MLIQSIRTLQLYDWPGPEGLVSENDFGFFCWWLMLQCVVGESAGGGFVAVAVSVGKGDRQMMTCDIWHMTNDFLPLYIFLVWVLSAHVKRFSVSCMQFNLFYILATLKRNIWKPCHYLQTIFFLPKLKYNNDLISRRAVKDAQQIFKEPYNLQYVYPVTKSISFYCIGPEGQFSCHVWPFVWLSVSATFQTNFWRLWRPLVKELIPNIGMGCYTIFYNAYILFKIVKIFSFGPFSKNPLPCVVETSVWRMHS